VVERADGGQAGEIGNGCRDAVADGADAHDGAGKALGAALPLPAERVPAGRARAPAVDDAAEPEGQGDPRQVQDQRHDGDHHWLPPSRWCRGHCGGRIRDTAPVTGDPGPQGLLVSGVYGVGKTSLVEEIADLLERRGVPYAAIDVDWLGWFWADDEATVSRVRLANLGDVVRRYLAEGVRYVALAHSVPDRRAVDELREALGIPLRVVGLRLPYTQIQQRLGVAVTRGRQDDLRVAGEWLTAGVGIGFEDLVLTSDRPVRELAAAVLAWLGWP
jgi:hypothetical protein